MNENLLKLIKLSTGNPSLRIVSMVDSEIVCDDGYCRWMASFGDCYIGEILSGEERYYQRSLDNDLYAIEYGEEI